MKRTFLPLLLLLALSAQGQVEWTKWHGQPNLEEALIAVEETGSPSHFWAAGTLADGPQNDCWLVLLDSLGQPLWQDQFGGPERNEQLSDFSRSETTGHLWLVGESRNQGLPDTSLLFLQKLDAAGQPVFEKTGLFGFFEVGTKTWHTRKRPLEIETVDDGALLFQPDEGKLRRLDAAAGAVWQRDFQKSVMLATNLLRALPDGGCLVVENFDFDSCRLHRLAPDGSTIWTAAPDAVFNNQNLPLQGVSTAVDPADGSVFLAAMRLGYTFCALFKFAPDGSFLWKKQLADTYKPDVFTSGWLLPMPQTGQIALVHGREIEVLDSATGDPVFHKNLAGSPYLFLNDGLVLPDGNLLVAGASSPFAYSFDGFVSPVSMPAFEAVAPQKLGTSAPAEEDYTYEPNLELTSDGGFYVANTFYDTSNSLGVVVRKTDAEGNEIWKNENDGPSEIWAFNIEAASDGGVFVFGWEGGFGKHEFAKLSATGQALWKKTVGAAWNSRGAIAATNDGGAVVFSDRYPLVVQFQKQVWATGFSADGTQLWSKLLVQGANNFSPYIANGLALDDGSLVAVGLDPGSGHSLLFFRLDPLTGEVLAQKTIPPDVPLDWGSRVEVERTADGNLAVLTQREAGGDKQCSLQKLTPDGELLAQKTLANLSKPLLSFNWLFRMADGKLVCSLPEPDGPTGMKLNVSALDENLETVGQVTLFGLPDYGYAAQKLLPDGSFVLSGDWYPTNSSDIFLLKTGKSGLVSTRDEPAGFGKLEVSPNPVPGGQPVRVLLENEFVGPVKFEVLSLDRRRVYGFEKEKTGRRLEFSVEKGLPDGPFLIRSIFEKGTTARLVVRH